MYLNIVSRIMADVFFFDLFISLNIKLIRFTREDVQGWISFIFTVYSLSLYEYSTVHLFKYWWLLGLLPIFAKVNNAIMHFLVQVSNYTPAHIPRDVYTWEWSRWVIGVHDLNYTT
jgi:hypothetical protein